MKKRGQPTDLTCRSFPVRMGPKSLDEENRTVDVVVATEAPAVVFDWERWEPIQEVLLMSGVRIPGSRQVPMLDSHRRYGTESVLGSIRELRAEGDELVGKAHFSSLSEQQYTKTAEGHITDLSAGYRIHKFVWIEDGKSASVEGRSFKGPMRVVTDWEVKEGSLTPIGADSRSKVRSEHHQGVSDMEKKLREFLELRGLSPDATEEQAWAFLETLGAKREESPPAPARSAAEPVEPEGKREDTPPVDPKLIALEAVRAERARIAEIENMAQRFGCPDEARKLIDEGKTIDEARTAILDLLMQRKEPVVAYRGPVVIEEERDKFRAASVDSLFLRSANEKYLKLVEKPAPGAMDLRGYSLMEMAREFLRRSNQKVGGDPRDMIGRALTTSDFPYLLENVANKSLMMGWETAPETWNIWCSTGSVNDFKIHTQTRPSEYSDLEEIPEGGEYKFGKRTEQREQYYIATYGKAFAITRQTIINDDLGALMDVPAGHGEAAARKIGDIAYAPLLANPNMGDGKALFHADHANLRDAALVGVDSIGEAEYYMGTQKDLQGLRRLNIPTQYFLAPKKLKTPSEQFFATMTMVTTGSTEMRNIYANAFTRVYEPRLDDDSVTAWYLAGPKGKTVVVFFLFGIQTPYMETREGWSVDGREFKCRIDAGSKAMDWKGLQKNPGNPQA